MIQRGDHIADQILSASIDNQLTLEEAREANAHLGTCAVCRARLDELRSVVSLLGGLPELEPPRDFSIGLRLVVDPPNVVRLRRWYGVARAGAGSLAAVFVLLSAGALYIDSQPPATNSAGLASRAQVASAPAPAGVPAASPAVRALAPAAPVPPASTGIEAPASGAASGSAAAAPVPAAPAPGAAAPAAGAAAVRAKPAPTPAGEDVAEQVTAGTSVRPLPTPVPTLAPIPTQAPPQVGQPFATTTRIDSAAPLRAAAAVVGVLAAFGLLATLIVRHRLRAASISPAE